MLCHCLIFGSCWNCHTCSLQARHMHTHCVGTAESSYFSSHLIQRSGPNNPSTAMLAICYLSSPMCQGSCIHTKGHHLSCRILSADVKVGTNLNPLIEAHLWLSDVVINNTQGTCPVVHSLANRCHCHCKHLSCIVCQARQLIAPRKHILRLAHFPTGHCNPVAAHHLMRLSPQDVTTHVTPLDLVLLLHPLEDLFLMYQGCLSKSMYHSQDCYNHVLHQITPHQPFCCTVCTLVSNSHHALVSLCAYAALLSHHVVPSSSL